jgi:mono/diheme cytochrome c family protein
VQPDSSKKNLRPLGILALFLVLGVGVLTAVNTAKNWSVSARARKLKNPVPSTDAAIAAGMQVYVDHCRRCHGEEGDGKGPKAAELSVAPGDFTDQRKMLRLADGELFWQITRGRLPMPAFEDKLSEEARWQVVDYIRTFSEQPADSPPATPARHDAGPQP